MQQRSAVTGEYQQIPKPDFQFSNKSESNIARIEESDQKLDLIGSTWDEQNASISISFPKPLVYIENVQGDEFLVYKGGDMELNKIYEIEWKGDKYGIRKTEKKVELFKFYSDNEYRSKG